MKTQTRLLIATAFAILNPGVFAADLYTGTNDFTGSGTPLTLGETNAPASTNGTGVVGPWTEPETTAPVVTNLAEYLEPASLPSPGTTELDPTPALRTNFLATGDLNFVVPPDTQGAAGTNYLFVMLNTEYRIQDFNGQTLAGGRLTNFWSPIWSFNDLLTDPRIIYDPIRHRWIAVVIAQPQTAFSFLLVAVSRTSDPFGTWDFGGYRADSSGVLWADYPSVGYNRNWFVVAVNMFTVSGNALSRSQFYVLNRTNLYAGNFNDGRILTFANDASGVAGFEIPAVTLDDTQTNLFLLQSVRTNSNTRLRLFSITGAIGSETLSTNLGYFVVSTNNAWDFQPPNRIDFARQAGITNRINVGDARLQNVVYRNGSLWCTHTVFLPAGGSPTRSSIQWWQINPAGNLIVQRGRVDDSSGVTFLAYPSLAVNRFNDVMLGYSLFSSNVYASAAYNFHAFSDPSDAMRGSASYRAGDGPYLKTFSGTQNRWGDYSATVVDPRNDTDLWTIQEFAATPSNTSYTNGTGRFGTQWGYLVLPVPTNDAFAAAITISGLQGSTNGSTVRATGETSEPTHAGNTATKSIWYKWTAPTNGSVVLDTIGSASDNALAAYTGSSVSGLTLVASDHGSAGIFASRIVFTATSGTTYSIAVDGFGTAQGNVTLNWLQPAVPVFTLHPQSQAVYQGNNVTFTANAVGRPDPTYQWRLNSANISAATNSSYSITGFQTNHAGSYTAVASNSSGSVTSAVAVLTVLVSEATLNAPVVTNNTFQLTVSQVSGLNYIIQGNTNLSTTNWVSIATNTAPFTLTDTAFTNNPERFYRAIYKP